MGSIESNAPLQAPCTPTKLSECQTESSVESQKKMKLSKEPYTFNVLPREMVKIMDASEKEDYLNKCRVAQKDILDVFISEGIFKRGGTLHISSTANASKGYTFTHLEKSLTVEPAPRTLRKRNQTVKKASLSVFGRKGLVFKQISLARFAVSSHQQSCLSLLKRPSIAVFIFQSNNHWHTNKC